MARWHAQTLIVIAMEEVVRMRNANRQKSQGRRNPRAGAHPSWRRWVILAGLAWLAFHVAHDYGLRFAGSSFGISTAIAQEKLPAGADEAATVAYCFEVPLPITDAVEKSVTRRVERAIRQLAADGKAAGGAHRPVLVFEFRGAAGATG